MHLQVIGRVQGVGFRWFARVEARRRGLAGWVRNNSDGSVEVAVAGPQQALDEMRRALSRGPAGSRVSGLRDLPPIDERDLDNPFVVHR